MRFRDCPSPPISRVFTVRRQTMTYVMVLCRPRGAGPSGRRCGGPLPTGGRVSGRYQRHHRAALIRRDTGRAGRDWSPACQPIWRYGARRAAIRLTFVGGFLSSSAMRWKLHRPDLFVSKSRRMAHVGSTLHSRGAPAGSAARYLAGVMSDRLPGACLAMTRLDEKDRCARRRGSTETTRSPDACKLRRGYAYDLVRGPCHG